MKLTFSFLFALAGLHSVIVQAQSQENCEADAKEINEYYRGEPYDNDVTSWLQSSDVREIHPNEPITMDFRPDRLNVLLDDDDNIKNAGCY
ncbi:hypothetical protein ASPWEDRAFT_43944 [Aspergillus wentii DTO 134E9]|uniref:Peptidase inhibitor I78 family protein n=1 Tax=Aspergillus wentii DTO 134E9 TaxID=1073089 RepID=A0A1L9RAM2_ASPWE|nr:uncharacterized protein ASPWEDRAFT_43944 [Aspergillus wentii DTO 134E9]KAI9934508.1 hypothetical protein MW887_000122 [Aspergillus wentii]OJJ31923.1 hypothetical protein ASPWEDRAFT_43944 [Aspergillus wentii DTO 134E9]